MSKFVILTDITCDLSPEVRERFGVADYVHGYVHFSDGRDFKGSLDWQNMPREEFYRALSNKHMKISTAPASPEEYYEKFASYAREGIDVLCILLSSKISSTYSVAVKGAELARAEFPERRIYCLDSCRMSGSLGLLTVYACLMQREGKSMSEIIEWLETNKYRVHQMGPHDDLMFVARRGRISTGKAIMGSFAGVKPMGDCNDVGYVSVLAKVKGIKKALDATVAYIGRMGTDLENQYILITHSNREEYATQLAEKLKAVLPVRDVLVSDVYMTGGANIGPGMICANFMGEPISAGCEKEREALTAVIASL